MSSLHAAHLCFRENSRFLCPNISSQKPFSRECSTFGNSKKSHRAEMPEHTELHGFETIGRDMIQMLVNVYLKKDTKVIVALLGVCQTWREEMSHALPWAAYSHALVKKLKSDEKKRYREPKSHRKNCNSLSSFLDVLRNVWEAKLVARSDRKFFKRIKKKDFLEPDYIHEASLYQSLRYVGYMPGYFLYFERSWYLFALKVMKENLCVLLDTSFEIARATMGPRGSLSTKLETEYVYRHVTYFGLLIEVDIQRGAAALSRVYQPPLNAFRFPKAVEFMLPASHAPPEVKWVDELAEALGVKKKETPRVSFLKPDPDSDSLSSSIETETSATTTAPSIEQEAERGIKRKAEEELPGPPSKQQKLEETVSAESDPGPKEMDEEEREEAEDEAELEVEYATFESLPPIKYNQVHEEGFEDLLPITEDAIRERAGEQSDFIFNYQNEETLPQLTRVERIRGMRMIQRTSDPKHIFHDIAILQLIEDLNRHHLQTPAQVTENALGEIKQFIFATLINLFELSVTFAKSEGIEEVYLKRFLKTAWQFQGGRFEYMKKKPSK